MTAPVKPYPGTQSVLRAVALLKAFSDERPEWSLTALAHEAGLNKTTAFRLLSALESEGMVARNGEGYTLGPELLVLGGRALRSHDLRSITHPALEKLAAATGETASLEILSGDEVLTIDEVMGDYLTSGVRSLGTRWPIHATSTGLAILAALPEARREALLQRPLRAVTPHTLTDPAAVRRFLYDVRATGIAVTDEMLEVGLIAVGAAVYNVEGRVAGAISVFGPKVRLTPQRVVEIGDRVRETAVDLSAQLGYRP